MGDPNTPPDLNTPGLLSKYYRDQILAEADVQYGAA
jgi:hypothetical protein